MSEQDKAAQAINPDPEYQEPNTPKAPEQDESRIGGQAVGHGTNTSEAGTTETERTGEGTGAKAGEYS